MRALSTRNDLPPGPRKDHLAPADDADEAPSQIDRDRVDIERELPLGGNEPIEREASEERQSPAFDE
ncbi:hypothetical protein [Bradyrhizobium sp. C9]|uniref:hypothetical protein n=1 Tax=Bradyrhizobium sp. C9 TaxID=142585 RepID=UPI000BE9ED99|nr:hypothetical protein [Bradyrhizobium sp. C9]PDT78422.1 hypothetical protein CO675_06880 [Bradyrhizobium sp. C9]